MANARLSTPESVGKVVDLERDGSSLDVTETADTKVRAEIDAIARMIEEEAEATAWPEEADRLQALAARVRARAREIADCPKRSRG